VVASANPAVDKNGKPKKIRKEKVRFGQAPRNSLPAGPEEAATSGADKGAGATPSAGGVSTPGAAFASSSYTPQNGAPVPASNADPLAPSAGPAQKTRYSARAKTEAATKAAAKVAKAKEQAASAPTPETAEEKATEKVQDSSLGLGGNTAGKKKKPKRQKGDPKERLQDKTPAPPAAKPDATPIPPASVRQNGEPAVTPVTPPPAQPDAAPAPPPK
jgi:peptidyl-prolyl cis-trans isomerase SurA